MTPHFRTCWTRTYDVLIDFLTEKSIINLRGEFMNKRFPFPKRYWVYLCGTIVFGLLLILNIYRTDSWTGDKPFSEFASNDWNLFFIFILEEVLIFALMILFAFLGGRISRKRNDKIIEQWNTDKYSGIKPGEYDYIWFDFDMTERALILKQGDVYKLYVQEYDERTSMWGSVDSVSVYDDLSKLKYALFYEFDFFCEENAELDEHGDEMFKQTNE